MKFPDSCRIEPGNGVLDQPAPDTSSLMLRDGDCKGKQRPEAVCLIEDNEGGGNNLLTDGSEQAGVGNEWAPLVIHRLDDFLLGVRDRLVLVVDRTLEG